MKSLENFRGTEANRSRLAAGCGSILGLSAIAAGVAAVVAVVAVAYQPHFERTPIMTIMGQNNPLKITDPKYQGGEYVCDESKPIFTAIETSCEDGRKRSLVYHCLPGPDAVSVYQMTFSWNTDCSKV